MIDDGTWNLSLSLSIIYVCATALAHNLFLLELGRAGKLAVCQELNHSKVKVHTNDRAAVVGRALLTNGI